MKKTTEKTDRNQRLYHYWLNHPGMTIAAAGRVFRLKKEVAWRIIKRMEKRAASQQNPNPALVPKKAKGI
jgi:Mor family transcriptional regulator